MFNLDVIVFGVAIGLSGAIPLGPVNLFVIRSTIRRGLTGAMWAGSGAMLGDGLFAAVAAFGVRSFQTFIFDHAMALGLAGGLILVVVGIKTARTHVDPAALEMGETAISGLQAGKKAFATLAMTLSNPAALAFVLGIFATMGPFLSLGGAPGRALLAVLGVMAGSLVWWLTLGFIVSHLRGRLTLTALDRINRWSGVALAAFGFAILMHAFGL